MKILFLALDIDLGTHRGDSVHTRNLAASFARAGHRVHLVVGAKPADADVPGVFVSVRPGAGDLSVLSHVHKVARGFRPDVIYERRFSPKIGAAASFLCRVPFAVEYNGIVEEEIAMQGRIVPNGPFARTKAILRVHLLRRAKAIVTVTEGLRDIVIRRYDVSASNVFVVENGVNPQLFRPLDREESRNKLGLPNGPMLCFVGNLVRWQGLHGLITALTGTDPSLRLVIVGEGPERSSLEKEAKEVGLDTRVLFAGEIRHDLVPFYIAAANAVVAPFSSERNAESGVSALKMYEYLACARPIIVTDITGAKELVESFECGLVVPPGDAQALVLATERVLMDSSYAAAAQRASEFVRRERSWDRTAEHVTSILEQVVSRREDIVDVGNKRG